MEPEIYPVRGADWKGSLRVWRDRERRATDIRVVLPDGREVPVDRDAVQSGDDAFHVPYHLADFARSADGVIPVLAEKLVVGREAVPTGSVQVRKHVDEHVERVDMPVAREEVDVRRVVIDRIVDVAPSVREEGDTTVIPVLEEQVIVTKQLVLKEEIHLTRRRTESRATQDVALRSERAEVVRLDAAGREVSEPAAPATPPANTSTSNGPARRGYRFLKDW